MPAPPRPVSRSLRKAMETQKPRRRYTIEPARNPLRIRQIEPPMRGLVVLRAQILRHKASLCLLLTQVFHVLHRFCVTERSDILAWFQCTEVEKVSVCQTLFLSKDL